MLTVEIVTEASEQSMDYKVGAEELVKEMLGFSHVIREIVKTRKPIVGHNCLMDVMKIYQHFIRELPACYDTFKNELHASFPIIFDTKHVSFALRRRLESHGLEKISGMLVQVLFTDNIEFTCFRASDHQYWIGDLVREVARSHEIRSGYYWHARNPGESR